MVGFPLFPTSLQQAGANLHNNVAGVGEDLLGRGSQMVGVPASLVHGFAGFMHGLQTGQNGVAPSITVQLPAATPAKAKAPAAAAATAASNGKAAAIDPSAALGKLSFRQLLSLSQASENLQPKGTTKTPSAGDQAGQLLMQMTLPAFQSTLAKAKTDEDKQTIIDNYRDKVLLPIMSRGNPMAGMFDPGGQ